MAFSLLQRQVVVCFYRGSGALTPNNYKCFCAWQACFDVREASAFWSKMSLMAHEEANVEFLSTHPSHDRRSEHLDNLMNQAIELRRQCQCPNLPHIDPRYLLSVLKQEMKEREKNRLPKEGVLVLRPQ